MPDVLGTRSGFPVVATFSEAALAEAVAARLVGVPVVPTTATIRPKLVVWTDMGDELAVRLDETRVVARDGMLYVSLSLETDQTGRSTAVVCLAIGPTDSQLGLVATTEATPRGDPRIVARWGALIERAVWRAVLDIVADRASGTPSNFAVRLGAHEGTLEIRARDIADTP